MRHFYFLKTSFLVDQVDGETVQEQPVKPIPTIRVDAIYVSEDDVFHTR